MQAEPLYSKSVVHTPVCSPLLARSLRTISERASSLPSTASMNSDLPPLDFVHVDVHSFAAICVAAGLIDGRTQGTDIVMQTPPAPCDSTQTTLPAEHPMQPNDSRSSPCRNRIAPLAHPTVPDSTCQPSCTPAPAAQTQAAGLRPPLLPTDQALASASTNKCRRPIRPWLCRGCASASGHSRRRFATPESLAIHLFTAHPAPNVGVAQLSKLDGKTPLACPLCCDEIALDADHFFQHLSMAHGVVRGERLPTGSQT